MAGRLWAIVAVALLLIACTSYGAHDEDEYNRVYEVFDRHMREALVELGIPTPTPTGVISPSQ